MKAQSMWSASLGLVALLASSCGVDQSVSQPEAAVSTQQQQVASTDNGFSSCSPDTEAPVLCTKENNDPGTPCLPLSEDPTLVYECTGIGNNAWQPLIVEAHDQCEGTIPVHRYNTGDDDQDGIPGCDCNLYPCGGEGPPPPGVSCDTDDFGTGPTTEREDLTYVQYLAWDSNYNISGSILSVRVQDTLKPTITLNGSAYVRTECYKPLVGETGPDPYMDLGATAEDICAGDLTGQILRFGEVNSQIPGTYTVEYQVRDGAYNQADPVARTVEVIDTLSPEVTVSAPTRIWPADGSLYMGSLSECAQVKDRCEGHLNINHSAIINSITSNEPGDDAGDIIILDNSHFAVRAERNNHGAGRVYTVNFSVYDNSNNVMTEQCRFYVPLNGNSPPPAAVSPHLMADL